MYLSWERNLYLVFVTSHSRISLAWRILSPEPTRSENQEKNLESPYPLVYKHIPDTLYRRWIDVTSHISP